MMSTFHSVSSAATAMRSTPVKPHLPTPSHVPVTPHHMPHVQHEPCSPHDGSISLTNSPLFDHSYAHSHGDFSIPDCRICAAPVAHYGASVHSGYYLDVCQLSLTGRVKQRHIVPYYTTTTPVDVKTFLAKCTCLSQTKMLLSRYNSHNGTGAFDDTDVLWSLPEQVPLGATLYLWLDVDTIGRDAGKRRHCRSCPMKCRLTSRLSQLRVAVQSRAEQLLNAEAPTVPSFNAAFFDCAIAAIDALLSTEEENIADDVALLADTEEHVEVSCHMALCHDRALSPTRTPIHPQPTAACHSLTRSCSSFGSPMRTPSSCSYEGDDAPVIVPTSELHDQRHAPQMARRLVFEEQSSAPEPTPEPFIVTPSANLRPDDSVVVGERCDDIVDQTQRKLDVAGADFHRDAILAEALRELAELTSYPVDDTVANQVLFARLHMYCYRVSVLRGLATRSRELVTVATELLDLAQGMSDSADVADYKRRNYIFACMTLCGVFASVCRDADTTLDYADRVRAALPADSPENILDLLLLTRHCAFVQQHEHAVFYAELSLDDAVRHHGVGTSTSPEYLGVALCAYVICARRVLHDHSAEPDVDIDFSAAPLQQGALHLLRRVMTHRDQLLPFDATSTTWCPVLLDVVVGLGLEGMYAALQERLSDDDLFVRVPSTTTLLHEVFAVRA
eukprot:PhM_4_TR394/c2_g5_i1/m.49686